MTLEITYFCDELIQLIVSQSDSEQEVQRYGMKKKYFVCWSYHAAWSNCELDNVKNRPQTAEVGFLKTELRKPSFRFLNFEVGSVRFLQNRYPKFSSDSAHP